MLNSIGREIPDEIIKKDGLDVFKGEFNVQPKGRLDGRLLSKIAPGESKMLDNIHEAIKKTGLKDGMTISFHHHFREGDFVLNQVMDIIAELGIKDLVLAPSSLTGVHKAIIKHIKSGVIRSISTSGVRGELADEISNGLMDEPIVIRSHGGRARAIECGDIKVDVAFLGVPSCDFYGNANGYNGKSFCGSLGYAKVDAKFADKVVLITDNLVPYPNVPASIEQVDVDYIVKVKQIGNPNGIVSGATRYTKDPRELLIAKYAAQAMFASGYFKSGYSMQCGTGGASLAVARFLKEKMIKDDINASFVLGGITGQFVEMQEEGLIGKLFDTQSFDLRAAKSVGTNPNHYEISASFYANPHNKGCAVNLLDFVILSALEVDINFNVNVITGSDGVIRGASGGHSDTAAGAKISMIVCPLVRGRIPTIVEKVLTTITPGESIDIVVTDRGIAINPKRKDLIANLSKTSIPIFTIEELKDKAYKLTGRPTPIEFKEKVVALVEYRDGSIIDVIKQVK